MPDLAVHAQTVVVLTGAILGISACVSLIGGVAYRLTLIPRLEAIDRKVDAVDAKAQQALHAIEPNGHEDEAHPDDRGVPLRTLTLRVAREQRVARDKLEAETVIGKRWHRAHELEHTRRDASWPEIGGLE